MKRDMSGQPVMGTETRTVLKITEKLPRLPMRGMGLVGILALLVNCTSAKQPSASETWEGGFGTTTGYGDLTLSGAVDEGGGEDTGENMTQEEVETPSPMEEAGKEEEEGSSENEGDEDSEEIEPRLELDDEQSRLFYEGDSVRIRYFQAPDRPTDLIAIFEDGEDPASSQPVKWASVRDSEGVVTFRNLNAGNFFAAYFPNGKKPEYKGNRVSFLVRELYSDGCEPEFVDVCTPDVNIINNGGATGDYFSSIFPEGPVKGVQEAICTVCSILYRHPSEAPPKDTIEIYIEPTGGTVAYATGGNEIHIGIGYIEAYRQKSLEETLLEFSGVLVHEATHLYQNNQGFEGCMIEGMADFVRIRAGLYPRGNRYKGGSWDSCYTTGGYFFSWLAGPCELHSDSYSTPDPDIGYEINKRMGGGWSTELFVERFGKGVDELWAEYQASI